MSRAHQYDLIIVGAGIAGLAIAEIFSRAGQRVALVEKNDKVCQESSGSHHEWFHFGSLYSIFPNNQSMRTLVGGIDDLLAYYSNLPGMNIKVGQDDGKLKILESPGMWIRDETIDYIVTARNDPDFSLSRFEGPVDYAKNIFFLLTWEMAIKQFIARHQRFHKFDWRKGQASQWVPRAGWFDYSRDVIFQVPELDAQLDKNTHFMVPGFDRTMNASAIIRSLLSSFLSHGGTVLTGSGATEFTSGNGSVQVKLDTGNTVCGKKTIFTSGKTLQQFLSDSGFQLKVVGSPLLVVYPQVCRQNFVRLTPFMRRTVNHLCHEAAGKPYSLIGGGYYADANDPNGIEQTRHDLVAMAKTVFPKIKHAEIVETYVSYKTELVSKGNERNYQYQVKQIAENTFVAIPGKFSLAFSLAINAYKRLMGSEPPASWSSGGYTDADTSTYMSPIKHRQIVSDYLGNNYGNQTAM